MGVIVRRVNENVYRVSKDALDDEGYVMNMIKSTSDEGKVQKCATSNLAVYGIASMKTVDPLTLQAVANMEVAIITDGMVQVKLLSTNAAIVEGDILAAVNGGFVDKYVPTVIDNTSAATVATTVAARLAEISRIVARSEQKIGSSAGGKIVCRLTIINVDSGANG